MKWEALLESVLMMHGIWAVLFIVSIVIFHKWIARIHQGRLLHDKMPMKEEGQ